MKSGPDCSVVIPTHGRRDALLACLEALASQTLADFEVIVVDDGSREALSLDPSAWESRFTLKVIRQEQAGPAAARNHGAEHANGDILAFTDDDCLPDPEWLDVLLQRVKTAPDSLCGTITYNGLEEELWPSTSQFIIDLVYAHFNASPMEAYFLASNNIACRRDVFLNLGGFDGAFAKAGAEDREFCDRWRMSGRPLHMIDRPLLQHRHHQSFNGFADIHFRYGRGAYLYQSIRRRRGSGTMSEDAAFHLSLPGLVTSLLPSRKGVGRKIGICVGLVLWQTMNTAGFLAAWWQNRRTPGIS
jgi:glycosyltransferase involved in cell wall biosynthesis